MINNDSERVNADSINDENLGLAEQEQELPQEIREKKIKGTLRTGFTTGTCSAAAAKAALYYLINGRKLDRVNVMLPSRKSIEIKIAWTRADVKEKSATSAVVKDGGDDPDVTHGCEICSTVLFIEEPTKIIIDGGEGVGRVTKPGTGLEVGSAAINPVPRKMIIAEVSEVAGQNLAIRGIKVVISVPRGREVSKKTDNPRLGIVGGISILGTSGLVIPYSTASFAAAIRQGIGVAVAMHENTVVLTTGGRSEEYSKILYKGELAEHCFIQMGDFAGYSIKQCAIHKISKVIVGGFVGKITKIAMGIRQTHVRGSHVSMQFMADIALRCNAASEVIENIRNANTARHVSEIIIENKVPGFFDLLCKEAHDRLGSYANSSMSIEVIIYGFEGNVLGKFPK